jgi:hypothetical protein
VNARILYKTSVELHQTTVWWDTTRMDADATLSLFADDAVKLSRTHRNAPVLVKQWAVEVPITRSQRGLPLVVNVLNNVLPMRKLLEVTILNSRTVHYLRGDNLTHKVEEVVEIAPTDYPTSQYAQHYQKMIQNPALYEMCRRASSMRLWHGVCDRANADIPMNIRRWLWNKVHHVQPS